MTSLIFGLLSSNTFISNNLDLTGNLSFGGSLNLLGDQTTDIVDFNVDFDQDINPNQNGIFSLGTTSKRWINTNSNRAYFGDVLLYNNYVTTFVSNADLELRANSTGKIYVPNNDLEIANNLANKHEQEFLALMGNNYKIIIHILY